MPIPEVKSEPTEMRALIRSGAWRKPTTGLCPGYVQANVAILPRTQAFDFLLLTLRNPRPLPLLDVTDPGSPVPRRAAPGADLRTDVPAYRIYRYGRLEGEVPDILDLWTDEMVGFLLGCSFSAEHALALAGVRLKHLELGRNVAMYDTAELLRPAGELRGTMVVSMRPIPRSQVATAVELTGRLPIAHGAPIQVGSPEALGIRDLSRPEYGDPVPVSEGEIPVFWACGVTAQSVARASRVPLMITHSPGHMFLTDLKEEVGLRPVPSLEGLER